MVESDYSISSLSETERKRESLTINDNKTTLLQSAFKVKILDWKIIGRGRFKLSHFHSSFETRRRFFLICPTFFLLTNGHNALRETLHSKSVINATQASVWHLKICHCTFFITAKINNTPTEFGLFKATINSLFMIQGY